MERMAPVKTTQVFTKGTCLVHYQEFIREQHGDAGMARISARLAPGPRKVFESAIAFEWYPMADVVAIQRAIVDELLGGDARRAQAFGRFDAERQLNRVFRFLLSTLSPESLFKRADRIIGQTLKNVTIEATQLGPRHWTLSLGGYDPIDVVNCYELQGSLAASLEFCRCKASVVKHHKCQLRGAPMCVFDATWE